MANMASLTLGNEPAAQPALEAPVNIVETKSGGVAVDPKIEAPTPTPKLEKPSYEDLEKSYNELRKKMSTEGAPKPDALKDVPTITAEAAAKAATDAGLDMDALEAEFSEKGALSEETLVKLEAKGLTRDQIGNYIKGQQARAEKLLGEFSTLAGGEERFKSVLDWANTNLSAEEIKTYNDALDGGNDAGAKMLLRGMVAAYEAINGRDPKLITGDAPRGSNIQPYESTAQITSDMAKPEYASDPAFRRKVMDRLAVSQNVR